ncbi:MAG: DUF2500 domain-containing protein [Bacillaceae bacterium]
MFNDPVGDFMFTGIPIFIGIVAIIVFGFIFFAIISGIKQWSHNNKQPILDVDAKVVAKRTEVSGGSHTGDHHSGSSTWYYVTFEVTSGDRMELSVSGKQYGLLAEGDKGILQFQGTRYLNFTRKQPQIS